MERDCSFSDCCGLNAMNGRRLSSQRIEHRPDMLPLNRQMIGAVDAQLSTPVFPTISLPQANYHQQCGKTYGTKRQIILAKGTFVPLPLSQTRKDKRFNLVLYCLGLTAMSFLSQRLSYTHAMWYTSRERVVVLI